MRLIEDLGMQYPTENSKKRHRLGLYECPVCGKHIICHTVGVNNGNTTKCRSCADKQRNRAMATKAASEFIEKAQAIHGDLYEYLLADYVNNKTKVKIMCPIHGIFEQSPDCHLRGQGCPHCALERSNIALRMSEKNERPTLLYYIHFPEVNLWKVGCTSRTIAERFKQETLEYTVIQTKEYTSGNEAYRVEKFILDATKEHKFTDTVLYKGGDSELRTQPINNIELLIAKAEAIHLELDS